MTACSNEVQQILWGDLGDCETAGIIQITQFLMHRTFIQDYISAGMLLEDTHLLTEAAEVQLVRIALDYSDDEGQVAEGVLPADREDALEQTMARLTTKHGVKFMMCHAPHISQSDQEIGRNVLMGIYVRNMIQLTHRGAYQLPCFQGLQALVDSSIKSGTWEGGTQPELWAEWAKSLAAYECQGIDWTVFPFAINQQSIPIESVWDLLLTVVVLSPKLVPWLREYVCGDSLNMDRVDQLITLFRFSVESGMIRREYVSDLLAILSAWFPENENLNIDLSEEAIVLRNQGCSLDDLIRGEDCGQFISSF